MICTHPGCTEPVSKAGHTLCYTHWKANRSRPATESQTPPSTEREAKLVTATALGESLTLSSRRINLVLSELGWISREKKGWVATPQGLALGAVQKEHHITGVPYVLWPDTLVENRALRGTVRSLLGEETPDAPTPQTGEQSFRDRFPASYRATDGHMVRSKAEMLIDNWLYMSGLVHAYERQLPVEEELYCDFYLPTGKVYIEYWGLEAEPRYAARKQVKQEIYRKYGLNLIELSDEHIRNLDDHLPKLLLRFNVLVS